MKRSLALIALALLGGCSMGPNPKRPEPIIPRSWPQGDAYLRRSEAALPTVSYRDILRDPKLQAIIERALVSNQDLRVAIANVAAARAEYRVAQSDIFPQLNAAGSMTKRRNPDNSSGANIGQGSGGGVRTTYQAQASVTAWEIDLFGRLQSLSNAAFDEYLGNEAAARGVRLTLVSEVANAYLQLAADRSLLAIAKDTEASASRSVDLTSARLKGGIAPRTDLRQAETILATAQSDQARQITAVAQDKNALELLVGGPVADAELPGGIDDVDGLLAELPAGLDSGILLRRPDVVQAEYQLYAANARIGAARAAFFPRIALTALTGFTSTALSSLFQSDAFTWSVAPSATLPIFDWGGNLNSLRSAKAQRDAAVATYQKAIQTAFRETSDALARRGTIDAQLKSDSQLESAARDNAFLADASYRGGIGTYLSALDSQRTAYSARRTLIATRLEKAQNLVTLYQTLGGDQTIDAPAADRAR